MAKHPAVERIFEGLPVIDAKNSISVYVQNRDIKKAKRKDPRHCVLAEACRRQYHSRAVLFLRRVAYVDLPDKNGKRCVHRFRLTPRTQEQIADFDKYGKAAPNGFLLSAPPPSNTLQSQADYAHKMRKLVAMGKHVPKTRKPNKKTVHRAARVEVRDGRGKYGLSQRLM
jgi:hypothetical protein